MKIYSVFVNYNTQEQVVLTRDEFSFPASIFTLFWAAYKRIWWLVAICLFFNILLPFLESNLQNDIPYISSFFSFVIMVVFGFFANDFLEYDLQRKGYELKDIIVAQNEIEAELKFFARVNNAI